MRKPSAGSRHIVLLRGINLVKRNRISMAELRTALEAAEYGDVRTYVQSGNVVLSSRASRERGAKDVNALITKRFGSDIAVLGRSHGSPADVLQRNPLARLATRRTGQ